MVQTYSKAEMLEWIVFMLAGSTGTALSVTVLHVWKSDFMKKIFDAWMWPPMLLRLLGLGSRTLIASFSWFYLFHRWQDVALDGTIQHAEKWRIINGLYAAYFVSFYLYMLMYTYTNTMWMVMVPQICSLALSTTIMAEEVQWKNGTSNVIEEGNPAWKLAVALFIIDVFETILAVRQALRDDDEVAPLKEKPVYLTLDEAKKIFNQGTDEFAKGVQDVREAPGKAVSAIKGGYQKTINILEAGTRSEYAAPPAARQTQQQVQITVDNGSSASHFSSETSSYAAGNTNFRFNKVKQ